MELLKYRLALGRWFRLVRSRLTAGRSRRNLQALRARAAEAAASFRPPHYLRAARLAGSLGLDSQALSLYGEAIDGYLETGRGRAAEVVCREVVEAYPQVVRARRTLVLIALGRGDAEEAAALLRDYAETAKRFGDQRLTTKSLRAMGLISEPGPLRSRAIAELNALGDEAGAQMVMEGKGVPQDEAFDAGAWSKALEAALRGADELRDLRPT
ncbi:MAG TPA: hypothetical protein VMM12_01010 [Longimicrobiales bacterium]|nr:hypothetical protein [Longimicrobiales bacterium]